jgi:hypothetical protein
MRKYILKISILFVIFVFILSCSKNKKNDVSCKLTGNNNKFWLQVNKYPNIVDFGKDKDILVPDNILEYIYLMSFNKNGEFFTYIKYGIFSKVVKNDFSNSDIVVSNSWELENDTIILIDNQRNIIDYLDDEILILHKEHSKTYGLWVVAPENMIKKDFRNIYEKIKLQ